MSRKVKMWFLLQFLTIVAVRVKAATIKNQCIKTCANAAIKAYASTGGTSPAGWSPFEPGARLGTTRAQVCIEPGQKQALGFDISESDVRQLIRTATPTTPVEDSVVLVDVCIGVQAHRADPAATSGVLNSNTKPTPPCSVALLHRAGSEQGQIGLRIQSENLLFVGRSGRAAVQTQFPLTLVGDIAYGLLQEPEAVVWDARYDGVLTKSPSPTPVPTKKKAAYNPKYNMYGTGQSNAGYNHKYDYYSNAWRNGAISAYGDVTSKWKKATEVPMKTGFDDYNPKYNQDFSRIYGAQGAGYTVKTKTLPPIVKQRLMQSSLRPRASQVACTQVACSPKVSTSSAAGHQKDKVNSASNVCTGNFAGLQVSLHEDACSVVSVDVSVSTKVVTPKLLDLCTTSCSKLIENTNAAVQAMQQNQGGANVNPNPAVAALTYRQVSWNSMPESTVEGESVFTTCLDGKNSSDLQFGFDSNFTEAEVATVITNATAAVGFMSICIHVETPATCSKLGTDVLIKSPLQFVGTSLNRENVQCTELICRANTPCLDSNNATTTDIRLDASSSWARAAVVSVHVETVWALPPFVDLNINPL